MDVKKFVIYLLLFLSSELPHTRVNLMAILLCTITASDWTTASSLYPDGTQQHQRAMVAALGSYNVNTEANMRYMHR